MEKIKIWFKENKRNILGWLGGFWQGWCLAAGFGFLMVFLYNLITGKKVVFAWRK